MAVNDDSLGCRRGRWSIPERLDRQHTEHREIDVAAADEAERHRAVEGASARKCRDRPAARIGERRVRHTGLRHRTSADEPVLGLKENVYAGRHVAQGRDADAEVHQHAGMELSGYASRDNRRRRHHVIRRDGPNLMLS